MGVTDDIWHHVCVIWESKSEVLAVFKDGEKNHESNWFRAGSLDVTSDGKCYTCFKLVGLSDSFSSQVDIDSSSESLI